MERIKNFIKNQGKKIEIAILTMALFLAQVTPALAAIDGNTIKNNLINNIILPIYIVIFLYLLVKEFIKKNVASAIIIFFIGGLIGIFIYNPDSLKTIIEFMSSLTGI